MMSLTLLVSPLRETLYPSGSAPEADHSSSLACSCRACTVVL